MDSPLCMEVKDANWPLTIAAYLLDEVLIAIREASLLVHLLCFLVTHQFSF